MRAYGESDLPQISFQALWRIVKILIIVQAFNAIMDFYVWFAYGFLVPSWVIATISVFYITLVWALKVAQEKEPTAARGVTGKTTC
jgi:hypothetical protein